MTGFFNQPLIAKQYYNISNKGRNTDNEQKGNDTNHKGSYIDVTKWVLKIKFNDFLRELLRWCSF